MMRKGDNMKNLIEYVESLCEDLTKLKNDRWEHCAEDGAYYGTSRSEIYQNNFIR